MSDIGSLIVGWHRVLAQLAGQLSLAIEARRVSPTTVRAWSDTLTATAYSMRRWSDENQSHQKEGETPSPKGTRGSMSKVPRPQSRAANKPRSTRRRR